MTRRTLLAAVLLTLPVGAQTPLPGARRLQIEQAVTAEMARHMIPGASISIATGGQVRWSRGFGLADVENNVPMTEHTSIRLGSIAKPITAVAVMQLVERGRVDLDAPIQTYLPRFPQKQWPVTARELLGHLAGIRHYAPGEMDSTRHYANRMEPLAIFAGDPLVFEPGTRYSYTTYGFSILGAIVEAVSGMPFEEYLRVNIFRPAELAHINVDDTFNIIPHRSRGYTLSAKGELQNCGLADTSNKVPGGGLTSPAEDLVNFILALQSGRLLKPETVRLMFTTQRTRDGRATGYGLGFGTGIFEGHARVGHSGGQQGTSTNLMLYPDDGVAIAIMFNRDGVDTTPLTESIARVLLAPLQ